MLLKQLFEGKFKKESAADIFARYESLKKSKGSQELLDKVLKLANDAMTFEMKAQIKWFDDKFAGDDWWETVKKLYKIKEHNNSWTITSDAKDWKQTKQWEFPTQYEANEQLLKLLKYKVNDRKAGHGSEEKDFERVALLATRKGW